MTKNLPPGVLGQPNLPDKTAQLDQRQLHLRACTQCGACARACAFLAEYGLPKELASMDHTASAVAFFCSLCGLCRAVCPEGLDPGALCMQLRREASQAGRVALRPYRSLLFFEWLGLSRVCSWRRLPAGGDTVFFPGCTLSGLLPGLVEDVLAALLERIPNCGLVLDCCGKSSHDLGRQDRFETAWRELLTSLRGAGVRRVLTACPNCLRVFSQYGQDMQVATVYEVLAKGNPVDAAISLTEQASCDLGACAGNKEGVPAFVLHDPCAARFQPAVHQAVRALAKQAGLPMEPGKKEGVRTFCCGEGGAVCMVAPNLGKVWLQKRLQTLAEGETLTYCGGCVSRLSRHRPTRHILEFVAPRRRKGAASGSGGASSLAVPGSLRHTWRRFRLRKRAKSWGEGHARPPRRAWSLRRWLAAK